ncbi:MAG: alpha/beta hydrolase [bacterium]
MLPLRKTCLALALLILSLGNPLPTQAQDAFDLTRISELAATDPTQALTEIDLALQSLAKTNPDPRLLHDLTRLAADLLAAQGRHAEAAAQYLALGQLVARNRQLDIAPLPLWTRAVAEYTAIADLRGAARAEGMILAEQQDGGLPGPILAATMTRLAEIATQMGDTVQAAKWQSDAKAALQPTTTGARGAGEGFHRMKVFYATDRARTGNPDPTEFYGPARGPLDYGVAEVTLPDSHVAGAIETASIWNLEFGPSPTKHVMLRSVTPMAEDAFFSDMRADVGQEKRKEIVVFIHGFNVTFDSAAKRAAQLAYDMNYKGVPVLYSWPSAGSTMGYISDTAAVQVSARHLTHFLDDLVAQSGAVTIHLVAHSMGNRALTEALELMALRHQQTADKPPIFDQVVFAAPDVDADLFAAILPTIRSLARRMTLYASENDWALVASRKLHGDMPRAGQGGADMIAIPDIDSVDMSALGDDMLAHSYFADDRSALVDLASLFWRNIAPSRRCGLMALDLPAEVETWRYDPTSCPDSDLLAVLGTLQQDGIENPVAASQSMAAMKLDPSIRTAVEPVVIRLLSN